MQSKEAQQTPKRINTKTIMPRLVIVRLIKYKEKILKIATLHKANHDSNRVLYINKVWKPLTIFRKNINPEFCI